jgi:hypothetical protein
MMSEPLYSIGTWDTEEQAYTPQVGVTKSFNITRSELRKAIKDLRDMGYSADRRGNVRDGHDDNDWMVLIEQTDGDTETNIREGWKR